MTNRLFPRPESNFTNFNSQRPANSSRQQHLAFAADLERQILEFEQRHAMQTCDPSIPQQRISNVASTAHAESEPCLFDDFGLVQGLEIDVRWM